MPYKIFLICFLLGICSGVIYEFIFIARRIVLLPTPPKPPKKARRKNHDKPQRPQHMPQRTQIISSKAERDEPLKRNETKRKVQNFLPIEKMKISERIFVIFSDIAYLLIVGVIFVELSIEYNFYELRAYMFVAVGLGIILYCKTLHKVIAFFLKKVYNKCTKVKRSVKEYYERRKKSPHRSGDNS